jgi:hypothetical protein
MMRAMAIIAAHPDGTPATATTIESWVHLQPSLTGVYQSYLVAEPAATLDALLADPACIVMVRFADVDDDGAATYAEMDQEHEPLRGVFNGFAEAQGLPTFPAGTTPRQLLAAFGITPGAAYVHDAA